MVAIAKSPLVRIGIGLPVAAAVTIGLFWLMQQLIHVEEVTLNKSQETILADFLAEERNEEVRTTQRNKPRRIETADKPPPPPKLTATKSDINLPTPRIEGQAPRELKFDRVQQIDLNPVVVSDRDAQPIRPPVVTYPRRAQERGIEGSCEVRFNVDVRGKPYAVEATCTDSVFKDEAERAVGRAEFAPKIVRGQAVERRNVVYPVRFTFG